MARAIGTLTNDFVLSISRTANNLEPQIESLSHAAEVAGRLLSGAEAIAQNMENAIRFTGTLVTLTEGGKRAAIAMKENEQKQTSEKMRPGIKNLADASFVIHDDLARQAETSDQARKAASAIAVQSNRLCEWRKRL
ncbi:MAG: hypothetical protein LBG43_01300 [Treponema sp.]|nr:hypothetical protein [Treponema sp.]